jgi:hypothetical protein
MATPCFYQVSLRTILELVFVVAVIFAFLYWRNVPRPEPGRYQVDAIDHGMVLYVDTATGEIWRGSAFGQSWQQVPTPPDRAKK